MKGLSSASAARSAGALVLVALIVALCAAPALAGPGAYIKSVGIESADLDLDGLIDYLNVSVAVEPPADGAYTIAVVLRWPTTGTTLASAGTTGLLSTSGPPLTFRLHGPTIREKQLDGPYNLTVELLSSPSGPVSDSAFFPTSPYHYTDFEQSEGDEKPRLNVGQEEISVSSQGINATVNLTSPRIRWGPSGAAPLVGNYEAAFPSVFTFDDDGDGAFEDGEPVRLTAPINATAWRIEGLEIGPDANLGSFIRFTLVNSVQFVPAFGLPEVHAQVEFSFLIAQRNGSVGAPTPYPLAGGYEVKVDMEVAPTGPLPGNALAMEVRLVDLTANSTFLVRSAGGYEEWLPAGDRALAALSPSVPQDSERISFLAGDAVPVAHFAWIPLATQEMAAGQERFAQVTASAGVVGAQGALRLVLSVPYSSEVRSVLFDPAVGMSPQPSAPDGPGVTPPPPPTEPPSLTIFIASMAAFAAIFFFSVYARAKKY